jgi:hypothetical protein
MFTTIIVSTGTASAAAKNYGNKLTAVEQVYIPFVSNVSTYTKAKPTYASSKGWNKEKLTKNGKFEARYKSIEKTANQYAATTSANLVAGEWKIKTELFMAPMPKTLGTLENPQSLAIVGKYIYVVYADKKHANKGYIVRYDYDKIKKAGLNTSKGIAALRFMSADFAYHKAWYAKSAIEKKAKACFKIGPTIDIGHGQSLAYDKITKSFYMWYDAEKKGSGWVHKTDGIAIIKKINPNTLKVTSTTEFKLKASNGSTVQMGHNLTFDNDGNAYFVAVGSARVAKDQSAPSPKNYTAVSNIEKIYRIANISKPASLKVDQLVNIKFAPNKKNIQSIGFNPVLNQLLIVADDSIQTIPIAKINNIAPRTIVNQTDPAKAEIQIPATELTAADIGYVNYKSKREFEAMTFDAQGYGYVLLNRGPEILKTLKPVTDPTAIVEEPATEPVAEPAV